VFIGPASGVIRIRRVELDDAALIEQYASDARVAETSHVPHPYPRGGGRTFALSAVKEWQRNGDRTFAVVVDDAFAGLVSLMAINRLRSVAQVGYWIGVPFWGRGIASEALRQTVSFAFDDLGLEELGAGCLAENLASARVLQKNGFEEQRSVDYRGPDARFVGHTIRRFHLTRERTPGAASKRAKSE